MFPELSYFCSLLHELGIVLLNVVPGPYGGLQLVPHHHAWPLRGWAPDERHNSGPGVRERALRTKRAHQTRFYNFVTPSYEPSLLTSRSPTAMDMATPRERKGLLPCVTGQGSRCSSLRRSVRFMSIFCTGCRNLWGRRH